VAQDLQNPDGTTSVRFNTDDRLTRVTPPDIDSAPSHAINGLLAAQIAVADLLAGIRIRVGDSQALAESGQHAPVRTVRLDKIIFDFPAALEEIQPASACVFEEQDQAFDEEHQPFVLDPKYSDDHQLVRLTFSVCYLAIEAWFSHKDERRAFRTAAQRALLKEPLADRGDRQIVVPQYYGRTVRLVLVRAFYPDNAETAQAGRFPCRLSLEAHVEEVMLTPRKAKVETQVRVTAT
jgi:hypothetical protein